MNIILTDFIIFDNGYIKEYQILNIFLKKIN